MRAMTRTTPAKTISAPEAAGLVRSGDWLDYGAVLAQPDAFDQRLLRPGGRMAFTTIAIAEGLNGSIRRRARRSGPRAVASRADQQQLLRSAGYVEIDEVDVTAAFIETMRGWVEQRALHFDEVARLEPPGAFEQRQRGHRAQLAATQAGLLRRLLFTAARP
jgi:hypothetical protein